MNQLNEDTNCIDVKLCWEGKDRILLGLDEKGFPIWGDEKDIKIHKFIEVEAFGEVNPNNSDNLYENADNLLIKGDNLYVLKALSQQFEGKIKCVYIDPPFNTGKTFDHYADALENSIWLSMIKIRLELIRNLLTDDGLIMVHIDDDEMPYLKILMDEIFKSKNRYSGQRGKADNHIATIIWQKKFAPQNDARFFSDVHDYILIYAKNAQKLVINPLARTNEQDKRYKNLDNDPRGLWTSSDLTVKTPNLNWIYPIQLPSGRKVYPADSRSWGFSKERFDELVLENRIWFGKSGDNMPRLKRFLSEVKDGVVPKTIWLRDEVGDNSEAKRELKQVLNNKDLVFTTPKPERLLSRIIEIASKPGDWVLDAFLGSGTTCAVAHKLNRKWIGIENGVQIDNICIPRIKKVIDGSDPGGITKNADWKGGGGFRYLKI